MSKFAGRRTRAKRPTSQVAASPPDGASNAVASPSNDIPPHVWSLLAEAGEQAAVRLLEALRSPRWSSYAPTSQARLIELAMVRAYGLPVRRSIDVTLTSSDADAVAQSLAALTQSLPERPDIDRDNVIDLNPISDSEEA